MRFNVVKSRHKREKNDEKEKKLVQQCFFLYLFAIFARVSEYYLPSIAPLRQVRLSA